MTGLGGDAFWLIYDAKQKRVRHLDGAGCAAASASIETFRARGMDDIPFRGILPATLTVPGAVASWCEAHAAHGRLPLARIELLFGGPLCVEQQLAQHDERRE